MPRPAAHFLLKLDCDTTAEPTDIEGAFELATWVSYDGGPVVDPNTDDLELVVGDQIAFAVSINQTGTSQGNPTWLNWLVVIMSATTPGGNRSQRAAGNNSPFRLSGTRTPLTLLLNGGPGAAFQRFNADGSLNTTGPYIGAGYAAVVSDTVPGSTNPVFPVSKYEATLVASLTDSTGIVWQFSFDPEMDVDNGGG
jgi:hypothetical protein